MKLTLAALAATAVAVFALSGVAAAADDARVRVLHASPDAPAVDVYVDGAEAISDLAFSEITAYVALPAGDHLVEVFPASADGSGTPVISATLTLTDGTDYTVAAVGELAAIEPLVLVDDNAAPADGNAHLRFVHASPDAPAVDIAVTGGDVVVPNAAFKDASGYLPLPAGSYDLEVRAAGTATVALPLPGIGLETGKVYTAFAIGLLDGSPALTAKLVVDASFDHGMTPPATGSGLADTGSGGPATALFVALGVVAAAAAASTAVAVTRARR